MRTITAALLTALIACSTAAASPRTIVTFDPWQTGLDAAAARWGPLDCAIELRRFATQRALMGNAEDDGFGTLAWAGRTPFDLYAPADQPMTCFIAYGPELVAENPGQQCVTIVHEAGHLHGRPHTTYGVMNPYETDWRDVPVCAKRIGRTSGRWCRTRARRSCHRTTTWYARRVT